MPSIIATRPTPVADRTSALTGPVLGVALALVAFRLMLTLLDRTELSTDEAQYWFFGQSLDFGAYSKPPLIGWIIRLSTDLLGQTVWAVRLPAVLLHGATALVILLYARRIAAPPVPEMAALLYLVTPAVALGSSVMTTDTPMLLAAAVALLAQERCGAARARGQPAPWAAAALGAALGLGLLAKHAMLFWFVGSVGAALLSPALRPGRNEALVALGVLLAIVSPHLAWLQHHGFVTVHHVQAITRTDGLSLLRPLHFLAAQLLVAGPIFCLAMGLALFRTGPARGLATLTLAPLVIVLLQGLRGPVLANWAVLYLVPGSVLAALWLVRHPWLFRLSLLLGLAVSLALPTARAFGTGLQRSDGRLVLARYLGHSEIATWAMRTATAQRASMIIAHDRDLLADLSWFAAGTGLAIRALPPVGPPAHHWEMTAPFRPGQDDSPLLLLRADDVLPCAAAHEVDRLVAPPGFAAGQTLLLFRLDDTACLFAPASHEDPA